MDDKTYKRSLNYGMVRMLKHLSELTIKNRPYRGWIRVSEHAEFYKKNYHTMEYSKLRHWGLLQPNEHDSHGMWRVTAKGFAFVGGYISVPRTVMIYDGETAEFSREMVSFEDITGKEIEQCNS